MKLQHIVFMTIKNEIARTYLVRVGAPQQL